MFSKKAKEHIGMKKWSFVLAVILVLMLFSACGVTGWDGSSSSQQESTPSSTVNENVSDENYEDNLAGLIGYFKEAGIITGDTETMQAAMIGAKDGARFTAKNYSVEIYEYDLSDLNETAQGVLASVREKGTFELLGFEAKASLSGSGKYLMVLNESDSDASIAQSAGKLLESFKR